MRNKTPYRGWNESGKRHGGFIPHSCYEFLQRDRKQGCVKEIKMLEGDRKLSEKRLARIVQRLESRYRLIHPELTDGRTTIVPFTDELKQMIKSFMGLVDVLSMDRFLQEEQSDDKGSRIETSAEERDRFFRMQESLNTHIVMADDYGVACARMRLNSVRLLVSGQYIGQTDSLKELKSHQVVVMD